MRSSPPAASPLLFLLDSRMDSSTDSFAENLAPTRTSLPPPSSVVSLVVWHSGMPFFLSTELPPHQQMMPRS